MLVSPVAAVGLVFVLVIFMLLERDELRDRFIRLVGASICIAPHRCWKKPAAACRNTCWCSFW